MLSLAFSPIIIACTIASWWVEGLAPSVAFTIVQLLALVIFIVKFKLVTQE